MSLSATLQGLTAPNRPHIPVLLEQVIDALAVHDGGVYMDGTFGAGGYSLGILAAAHCKVVACDRDPDAVAAGRALPECATGRLHIIHGRFGDLDQHWRDAGLPLLAGLTLDIGVSSMQIDQAQRGFSFAKDGPLDMRMEQSGPSAADLVNTLPETELANIIYQWGEERQSRRIARAIVEDRRQQPFERTQQLADLVRRVVRKSGDGIDPATRTFQALRIEVNDELGELRRGLQAAERILAPGGRLAVVTFHSLEDRVVKQFMKDRSGDHPAPSRHLPVSLSSDAPTLRLVSRKAITATPQECAANPRARSAKLRVAERTEAQSSQAQAHGPGGGS